MKKQKTIAATPAANNDKLDKKISSFKDAHQLIKF